MVASNLTDRQRLGLWMLAVRDQFAKLEGENAELKRQLAQTTRGLKLAQDRSASSSPAPPQAQTEKNGSELRRRVKQLLDNMEPAGVASTGDRLYKVRSKLFVDVLREMV